MKLEGNEQSQRFDLILALLQKGNLSYHDRIALDKNIKKLEAFLYNHGEVK